MYHNGGNPNYAKSIGSTFVPYFVGDISQEKSRLKCKIYCSTPMYIALCHAIIIYAHSISLRCEGFEYIMVFINTIYQMALDVGHLT